MGEFTCIKREFEVSNGLLVNSGCGLGDQQNVSGDRMWGMQEQSGFIGLLEKKEAQILLMAVSLLSVAWVKTAGL